MGYSCKAKAMQVHGKSNASARQKQCKCKAKSMQVHGKLQHKSIEFAERREMSWCGFKIYFLATFTCTASNVLSNTSQSHPLLAYAAAGKCKPCI